MLLSLDDSVTGEFYDEIFISNSYLYAILKNSKLNM